MTMYYDKKISITERVCYSDTLTMQGNIKY